MKSSTPKMWHSSHSPWALAVLAAALPTLLGSTPVSAVAGDWAENDQSAVRWISPWETAPAGTGTLRLGLEFRTEPGWHVYWKNAGDAGYPPAVDWSATPEVRSSEILWPAPHRYELPGDLVAFGYEGSVIYPIELEIDPPAAGPLRLTAEVDYLVCEIDCIPYRYELSIDQSFGTAAADDTQAPRIARWEGRVPKPAEEFEAIDARAALEAPSELGTATFRLEIVGASDTDAELDLFFAPHDEVVFGRPNAVRTRHGARFAAPVSPLDRNRGIPDPLEIEWTVTGIGHEASPAGLTGRATVPHTGRSRTTTLAAAPESTERRSIPSRLREPALALSSWLLVLLAIRGWRSNRPRTGWLGFGAAAAVVGTLYLLGRGIGPAAVAGVELILLATALVEALRNRRGSSSVSIMILIALAAATVWIAARA